MQTGALIVAAGNPREWETLNPCFSLDLFPLHSA